MRTSKPQTGSDCGPAVTGILRAVWVGCWSAVCWLLLDFWSGSQPSCRPAAMVAWYRATACSLGTPTLVPGISYGLALGSCILSALATVVPILRCLILSMPCTPSFRLWTSCGKLGVGAYKLSKCKYKQDKDLYEQHKRKDGLLVVATNWDVRSVGSVASLSANSA